MVLARLETLPPCTQEQPAGSLVQAHFIGKLLTLQTLSVSSATGAKTGHETILSSLVFFKVVRED